jgi:hypothetical protein
LTNLRPGITIYKEKWKKSESSRPNNLISKDKIENNTLKKETKST